MLRGRLALESRGRRFSAWPRAGRLDGSLGITGRAFGQAHMLGVVRNFTRVGLGVSWMTVGYRVAVVGATGLVGETLLQVLRERQFPVSELVLLASERSEGARVAFGGRDHVVKRCRPGSFRGCDFAFFCVGAAVSRKLVPQAVREGAVVIDKSDGFRMDAQVPLVVPEVNPEALNHHRGIVASPNCSTIQLVMVLAPLMRRAGLERVTVATYQSVSGAGREAVSELETQVKDWAGGRELRTKRFPEQIAFNLLPHIGRVSPDGHCGEEVKLMRETRKILGLPDLPISATTVRVPVFVGHAQAVAVEMSKPLDPDEARALLARAPGLAVWDPPDAARYPTPRAAAGRDEILVGRIRKDPASPKGLLLWTCNDNLRKGAATNAVQIAEEMIRRGIS